MARLVAEKAREIVTENGTVVKLTDLVGRKTEQGRNAILSRGEDWGLISISNSSGWVKVTKTLGVVFEIRIGNFDRIKEPN